jgi:hypothetical protein
LLKISKRGNKPHQLVSREILTLIFSKTMKMFTILAAAALSTVAAKVATEPCAVIKNKDGAATQYSFKCAVETKQKDGKNFAYFSRPFQLSTSSGISLPDLRVDPVDGSPSPFTYYFNPLGSLSPASTILKNRGCEATGTKKQNSWAAGAYQWDSRLKAAGCTRLTGPATPNGATETTYNGWTAYLLDVEDATQGLMLHMSGGDACGIEGPRKFNISLMCGTAKDVQAKDFLEESVMEDETCTYEIDLETTHGCPDECKAPFDVFKNGKEPGTGLDASKHVCNAKGSCRSLADGTPACACTAGDAGTLEPDWVGPGCAYDCPNLFSKPCSNQGHCSYQPPNLLGKGEGSHCFCNTGYEGETCETKVESKTIDTLTSSAAPWVILVFLGFIFAGAWWYHRKENEKPFCCCGSDGMGDGFESSSDGPPAFSAMGDGKTGGYVAPTDSAI